MSKRLGRPPGLTPGIHERIVAAISVGNYIHVAALANGVPKDTCTQWLLRGNKEHALRVKGNIAQRSENRYVSFALAVQKAIGASEVRDVDTIDRASQKQWQAAAWKLERSRNDRWGRKDKVNASVQHTIALPELVLLSMQKQRDKLPAANNADAIDVEDETENDSDNTAQRATPDANENVNASNE